MQCAMDEYKINPMTWFTERKQQHKPKHFVSTSTPLTTESIEWIANTLEGRYYLTGLGCYQPEKYKYDLNEFPAFEDPKEAILYELKWS